MAENCCSQKEQENEQSAEVEDGVGCAAAIVYGMLTGKEPQCGCSDEDSKGCC